MQPKILICTVESWNSKIGANTFSSLFSGYPADRLANVYIREELPDSTCCSRYFQISETKVIRSLLRRSTATGREVKACQTANKEDMRILQESQQRYNKNRKNRSYLKLFGREAIWKLGKWNTRELNAFLDDFAPDIVVFGMEGYIHFNRLCRHIVKHTKAKAIGYFWDDNFTYKQMPGNTGFKLLRFFQRRSLKKTAPLCSAFWAITEKTKAEADQFFGIDCSVLTKPIDFESDELWKPYVPGDPIRMLYTGNLLIGRFDVIKEISAVLERINQNGTRIVLDVYSGSYIAPEDVAELNDYVRMRGVVPQEQVLQLQKEADVLLFVEALSGKYSHKARLSFSTKLTDYLHSGKCIFAVGAADTAPMEYLRKEDAALCATTTQEITDAIELLVNDTAVINKKAQNAYLCGIRNHSRAKVLSKVQVTISGIMGEKI